MKKEAVLHIPMSEYAHGIDEDHYVFRLRAAKGDIKECHLFYGDTACRQTPIIFTKEPMKIVAQDDLFDYFEVEMKGLYHRIYYYFYLNDGVESIYYYSDFFRKDLVDDRSEYYKLPFNHRADIAKVPEWVKSAVIYNIFPDSFATGHRYLQNKGNQCEFNGQTTVSRLGGTIRGIGENADYLQDLGVTCIYINPIFAAGEYHKYDTLDYKRVDPCFGTNEEFGKMVKIMHNHGIRVIIDGVFNHCGWYFPAFQDVVEKGEESSYKDWFYNLSFPVIRPDNVEDIPGYECFAYERLMPKLNTSNPEVMDYLLDVAVFWIQEFDIDGWRLDVASEVNDDFWRAFRKAVKAVKPDCFLIGEIWENARHWLDGSQFDSTMNYDFRKFSTYFFAKKEIDASTFNGAVTSMLMRYRKNLIYGQLNLLDSHDVSRFYSVCSENESAFKLAVLFQMLFVGVPSIFYGDEQGIGGIKELDYRTGMCWHVDSPLYTFYKKAIALRKENAVFSKGDYKTLCAEKGSMLYGFERVLSVQEDTDEGTYEGVHDEKHEGLNKGTHEGTHQLVGEGFQIFINAGENKAVFPNVGGSEGGIGVNSELVWSEGYEDGALYGQGFAIFKVNYYN